MEIIKKITAPNPGVFTGAGTNTYLVGKKDITLIDPGPNDVNHIKNILDLGEGNIKRVLVTHTHKDHSPAAKPIAEKLNVPKLGQLVHGDSIFEDETFLPDQVLKDKDILETEEYTIEIIHTPGHASNHLCFLIKDLNCLITGDHIMDGSTVVIAPPDGCMSGYIQSLKKLINYEINYLAPGHGEYMYEPYTVIKSIIEHRLKREEKVLDRLRKNNESKIEDLVLSVYDDVDSRLHPIALLSLEAHLIKLKNDQKIMFCEDSSLWKSQD